MIGARKMEAYNQILGQFHASCGEVTELAALPDPELDPREKIEQMKNELKESASVHFETAKEQAKNQLEKFKKSTEEAKSQAKSQLTEIQSIKEKPMPKSALFDGFLDNVDQDQLDSTFKRLKDLMAANGITPDDDFLEFEAEIDNFIDYGSTSF